MLEEIILFYFLVNKKENRTSFYIWDENSIIEVYSSVFISDNQRLILGMNVQGGNVGHVLQSVDQRLTFSVVDENFVFAIVDKKSVVWGKHDFEGF